MNIVLFGATKGMGRALARRCAQRGDRLFLLGRHLEDLERSACDLRIRAEADVGSAYCDLAEPDSFEPAAGAAREHLGRVDAVVVTAGVFATQAALERDAQQCRDLLTLNFVNTVLFCEIFRRLLLAQGGGTLCVFSSVAGDRARKPVIIYGASKAGLSHYLEGLDHKYAHQGLHVVTVKPGFVKTSMTAALKPPPFAGTPEQVAEQVARALEKKPPVVYTPKIWRLVMMVIRAVPRFVMRKVSF